MNDSSVTTDQSVSQVFPDPIPGIIPFGSLCVVAGASGAGKTILLAEWMERLRAGRTICGHQTNRCSDYYVIAADRDWRTYHRAYTAAGFPEIKRYVLAEDPEFDPQNWGRKHSAFTLFERCLEKIAPIPGSIVYVDPVAPLFIQGNQNDARDVALSLHWYRKMAKKYQITLILFANVGKQKQEETYRRAQDRIAGSGAFVAYSDTQISIDQDEDRVMTMRWTPRNHQAEEFQFDFDIETRLFTPHAKTEGQPGLAAHLARIYELVPDPNGLPGAELFRQVREKFGLKSKSNFYRHLTKLVESGVVAVSDLGVVTRRKPS